MSLEVGCENKAWEKVIVMRDQEVLKRVSDLQICSGNGVQQALQIFWLGLDDWTD